MSYKERKDGVPTLVQEKGLKSLWKATKFMRLFKDVCYEQHHRQFDGCSYEEISQHLGKMRWHHTCHRYYLTVDGFKVKFVDQQRKFLPPKECVYRSGKQCHLKFCHIFRKIQWFATKC